MLNLLRGLDQTFKETAAKRAGSASLRMPLHADMKLGVGISDRLDHTIRSLADHSEGPGITHSLMVSAVHGSGTKRARHFVGSTIGVH